MRVSRPALVLALAGSFVAAGTAGAATKPKPKPLPKVCNLVVDPKGDTSLQGTSYTDSNLDVVGGDLASDGKSVTAVMRLASLSTTDSGAPFGRTYYFGFNAPGVANQVYLSVAIDPVLGTTYDYGDLEGNLYTSKGTDASGSIDTAKGTLTVTAPADLGGLTTLKKGTKLVGLDVKSTALVGLAGTGLVETVDEGMAAKGYTVGQASCVIPGKG